LPLTLRHEALTFQVPTTLPPQAVTLEQEAVAPPLFEPPEAMAPPPPPLLPPAPSAPPLFALPPAEPFELVLQAPEISPMARAMTRAADWIFIDGGSFNAQRGSRRMGMDAARFGNRRRRVT
jgi:hypothetical protein